MLRSRERACVDRLHPEDADLLRLRYGLGDADPHTQHELAALLGLTQPAVHERIRAARRRLRVVARLPDELEAASLDDLTAIARETLDGHVHVDHLDAWARTAAVYFRCVNQSFTAEVLGTRQGTVSDRVLRMVERVGYATPFGVALRRLVEQFPRRAGRGWRGPSPALLRA